MGVRLTMQPFLFAIVSATTFFLVKSQGDIAEPVLDDSGKTVRTGASYLVLPVGGTHRGGLDVSSIRNQVDTLVVSQNNAQQPSVGDYLRFSPVNATKNETIRTSTDLNVKFTGMIITYLSTVWRINTELIPQRYLVTVGGVEGNPGRDTIANWFKIEKYEDAYKLVYCPSV